MDESCGVNVSATTQLAKLLDLAFERPGCEIRV